MNGVMGMKEWNECPYCKKEFDVDEMGLYDIDFKSTIYVMCPCCNKAFLCELSYPKKFNTWSVEDALDYIATMFTFNRKVDGGDLSEEEIEEFREDLKMWV